MYDIIGDIHGYAEPLKRLLEKLGYTESNGIWQHPVRKVIFVGDYIDRWELRSKYTSVSLQSIPVKEGHKSVYKIS